MQDSKLQRRTLEDNAARSRKEAMLSNLLIQPNGDNRAGRLSVPGKFKLLVKADLWTTWSQDPSTIPLYILDALAHHPKSRADKRYTIQEMELTEGIFRQGDNYVVDEIEKDGAEMLITKNGQSEIAFAVTGRDIKCAGHKLAMIGRPYDHRLYIGWVSQGLLREQVLDHYAIDGYGERYQTKDRVQYQEAKKDLTACSWMVYTRELEKDDPRTLSCVRVPGRVAETLKLPAHLILGMGFKDTAV